MMGYSGEYDGEAVGEVGDVGCFLFVYAQCAAFFNFMGWILRPQRSCSILTFQGAPSLP